ELYVTMDQVSWVQGDTAYSMASNGTTAGSQTTQVEGVAMRDAAAAAFQAIQTLAAGYFGVPAGQLSVSNGTFSYKSKRASFGQVIGNQVVTANPASPQPLKDPGDYSIVGEPVPRLDLPAKFFGDFTFSADVRRP